MRKIYEVRQYINSEPTISFSLPAPDWCLLEQSELWRCLDNFLEACQSTGNQMNQREKLKILENGKGGVRKVLNNYVLGNEKLTEKEFSDKYWMGGQKDYIYQFHSMDIEDGQDERQQLLINNDRALQNLISFVHDRGREKLSTEVKKIDEKISESRKAIRCLTILQLLEAGIIIFQILRSLPGM